MPMTADAGAAISVRGGHEGPAGAGADPGALENDAEPGDAAEAGPAQGEQSSLPFFHS